MPQGHGPSEGAAGGGERAAPSPATNPTYGAAVQRHRRPSNYETMEMPLEMQANTPSNTQTTQMPVGMQEHVASNTRSSGAPPADDQEDAYKELRKKSSALVIQDREAFVPTRAYQRAQQFLSRRHVVIIRGTPCSGKTALGLSLLRHFAMEGYAPLVLRKSQDWRNHIRPNRKQCILLDSVFGEVAMEKTLYVEWQPVISHLTSAVRDNSNCLVVLTLHSHIMAHLRSMTQLQSSFEDIPVVDQDELQLTPKEKEDMLKKHLAAIRVKTNARVVRGVISRDHSGTLFPLCCRNYVKSLSKHHYVNLMYDHKVFTTPGLVYIQFFSSVLKQPDNWLDLVPLLMLALNQSGSVLAEDEQMKMKLRMLGLVIIDVDMKRMRTWATLLKGSILSQDMKQFKTKDLSDGFGFALYENQSIKLLLKGCSAEFLMKYVHVESAATLTDIFIDHSSPYRSTLLQRISHEILKGNMVQMSQHPALQNEEFLKEFEAFLLETQCLKALLSEQDPGHGMPLLYWSAWNPCGVLTCWCLSYNPCSDDGSVVRQTFLACSLFGEKVNTPRMARMFQWLCEHGQILGNPVSPVFLPVPAAEDRLCDQVKEQCQKLLNGRIILTCGLPDSPILGLTGESQTEMSSFLHDGSHSSSLQAAAAEGPRIPSPRELSDNTSNTAQKMIIGSNGEGPETNDSLTISNLSEASSLSSSTSSGTYISLSPVPEATKRRLESLLSIIAEHGGEEEEAGESAMMSEHADILGELGERGGRKLRKQNSISARSSRSSSFSGTLGGHEARPKATPLPDSTVCITLDKEEGRVVIRPICSRWYTFLRLVSLCQVDERNRDDYTLLHSAAHNGEIEVVKFLVEFGADLAAITSRGNTPLTKAIDRNHVEVVSFLLNEGTKALLVSTTDPATTCLSSLDLSWTLGSRSLNEILLKTVHWKRLQMLRLLFAYGLKPDRAEMGSLLKEAASVKNNREVIRFLQSHGSGEGARSSPASVSSDSGRGEGSEAAATKRKSRGGILGLLRLRKQ